MKINKLKARTITVCCLVAALWSEAQCMESRPDIEEKGITRVSYRCECKFGGLLTDVGTFKHDYKYETEEHCKLWCWTECNKTEVKIKYDLPYRPYDNTCVRLFE